MAIVSYAQDCEDVILYRVLQHVDRGFYVDVGAYRPEYISVTKLFYDRGWAGINIEPGKRWFDELVRDRPRDINLSLIVSEKNDDIEFYECNADRGGYLSTCNSPLADSWRKRGIEFRVSKLQSKRLVEIFDEYAPPEIHFLKIDVEGGERSVLLGTDFTRYRPWIIVVEAVDPVSQRPNYAAWESLITEAGYKFGMEYGFNRYYWAIERPELAAALSLPFVDYVNSRERELLLQIQEMKKSASWRVTAPLRAIADFVRRRTTY